MNKYRCTYTIQQSYKPATGDVEVVAENEKKAKDEAKAYLWKNHPAVELSANLIQIEKVELIEENVDS